MWDYFLYVKNVELYRIFVSVLVNFRGMQISSFFINPRFKTSKLNMMFVENKLLIVYNFACLFGYFIFFLGQIVFKLILNLFLNKCNVTVVNVK